MDVAVGEEPQKKIFRARKTMKMSDRQQLESLHNALLGSCPPSPASPPLVNGKHGQEESAGNEDNDENVACNGQSKALTSPPTFSSPSPLTLSLSLSPASPAAATVDAKPESPPASLGEDPVGKSDERTVQRGGASDTSEEKEKAEEELKERTVEDKQEDVTLPQKEVSLSKPDSNFSGISDRLADTAGQSSDDRTETPKGVNPANGPETLVAMETDPLKKDGVDCRPNTTASSPSSSQALESDQELKEGFLVLSEDDSQTEKEQREWEGEAMEVDVKAGKVVVTESAASPGSSSALVGKDDIEIAGVVEGSHGRESPLSRKRSLCVDDEDSVAGLEKQEKRLRVELMEREELEAHLELKFTGDEPTRQRLEKVVQHLVAEQLRALQLSVFDRSLQELRERVEKLDCAKKHQQTLTSLQAKIARLAKKFGAANQAKENAKRPQEVLQTPASATSSPSKPSLSTPESRMVRPAVDSRRGDQTHALPPAAPAVSTGTPLPSKPISNPVVSTSVPGLSLPSSSTASAAAPPTSLPASQNASGALMLKSPCSVTLSTPVSPAKPMFIHLPLSTVTSTPLGGHSAGGVELIPMSPLNGRPKQAPPTTAFILQKGPTPSALPSPPSLPRANGQPGGSGTISMPNPGVSVASSRTPTHCSSTVSSPAATGAHSSGATAAGTVPTSVMASKTDNQSTSRTADPTPARAPAQVSSSRGAGAVIDLTEEDDDVQVTGVTGAKKLAVQPSSSSAVTCQSQFSMRSPPVHNGISGTSTAGTPIRLPLQGSAVNGPQLTVHHRPQLEPQPKKPSTTSAVTSSSAPAHSHLPPLPPAPGLPSRLPPEAVHTSPPQQTQLKLARVQSQNGIVLSWTVTETDRNCAAVDSYHLYAYHQDQSGPACPAPLSSQWKKIGEVKALALPMACTLTQFVSGSKYYFAVRARDVYGRYGPFCEPQCTDVITQSAAS